MEAVLQRFPVFRRTISLSAGFGAAFRRLRQPGPLARFTVIGVMVGALAAGGVAWFFETRLTELELADTAARASDQVELRICAVFYG